MTRKLTEGESDTRLVLRRLTVALRGSETETAAVALPVEGLSGRILARDGSKLTLELDPLIAVHSVAAGDLVEMRTPAVIYMGQVRAIRGLQLTVNLEHTLDVASLDAIQRIWSRSITDGGAHPEAESSDSLTSVLTSRTIG
jgi:hypothetical protein